MADFRKMTAWQKTDDLAVRVYELSRDLPDDERFGLFSQLRRAAVSIPANIAEGAGRQTLKDFRSFLYMARGSLNEVEYYCHLSRRLNYLDEESVADLIQLRQETGSTLQGLINWATREIESGRKNL